MVKTTATLTEDVPFTARLPDGRTLFVLVPAKWCELDADGEVLFKPEAARFLDRVQAMAQTVRDKPTPGMIRSLREAMGLTQAELGERLGVTNITVYRWEAGMVAPNAAAVKRLEKLRRDAGRRGVVIDAA
jgi:DNA-binding transcriptional regulator YiaG